MTPATTRVYLHIGAPKTGTTYLQAVLFRNRAALAEQGVLYPGTRETAHYEAVLDLRGLDFGGYHDPRADGAWSELAAAAHAWTGHSVVVSHELLAGADAEAKARTVASFGTAEVHIVYTARDLGRQVPAMWQESLKNGQRLDFEQYVQRLAAPEREGRAARIFWRQQHVVEVLRAWGDHVPPERLHVVLVPPRGRPADLLWRRFAGVVGIDGEGLRLDAERTNVSLRLAEAELLRRVNIALDGVLDWPQYAPTVKFWFAEQVLAGLGDGPRATIPESMYGWVRSEAAAMADALATSRWDVVGDLDELRPVVRSGRLDPAEATSDEPTPKKAAADGKAAEELGAHPPAEDVLDAAAAALAALLTDRARRPPSGRERAHAAGQEPGRPQPAGLELRSTYLGQRLRHLRHRVRLRQRITSARRRLLARSP